VGLTEPPVGSLVAVLAEGLAAGRYPGMPTERNVLGSSRSAAESVSNRERRRAGMGPEDVLVSVIRTRANMGMAVSTSP
jgi:hypothetical protein